MTAITHKSDETDGRTESFIFAPPKAQPTRTRARGVTDLLVASPAQSNHHACAGMDDKNSHGGG